MNAERTTSAVVREGMHFYRWYCYRHPSARRGRQQATMAHTVELLTRHDGRTHPIPAIPEDARQQALL